MKHVSETGIKDVYWGVQGACPRRAVTHAGGTAERSEHRAVGMGLNMAFCKLISFQSLILRESLQKTLHKERHYTGLMKIMKILHLRRLPKNIYLILQVL